MIGVYRSTLNVLKELNTVLTMAQKKRAVFVFFIGVICSFMELLGVTAILPFMQALVNPEALQESVVMTHICTVLPIYDLHDMFLFIAIGLIVLFLVKNAFIVLGNYYQSAFASSIQRDLSIRMLQSYMNRPYSFFLNCNSGEILRGCRDDTFGVYLILSYLCTILTEGLTVIAISMFIFVSEPFVASTMLMIIFLIGFCMVYVFRPYVKKIGKKNLEALAITNKAIYQAITGIKEIYVTQRKRFFMEEYEKAANSRAEIEKMNGFLNSVPDRVIEGICVSGLIGTVVVRLGMGVDAVQFVPQLGVFAMAAFKLLPSIAKITNRMNSIMYYTPTLDNVSRVIAEATSYEKKCKSDRVLNEPSEDDYLALPFNESIHLNGIKWRYENSSKNVLDSLFIDIKKGESVAFIGESGSGKTTLADILLGLLHPSEGEVLLDDTDVFSVPYRWASTIGYVPQAVFLIDDTIRNNVSFGLNCHSDTEIWEAIKRAQLDRYVKSLPDGLDTIVGERGVKLSGGQRQRVAIARALFAKPQILVLDEATSALDNDTESAVMDAIDALQGQITMIIIAHRLSTIRNCDRIFEIANGKAIERSHEEIFAE